MVYDRLATPLRSRIRGPPRRRCLAARSMPAVMRPICPSVCVATECDRPHAERTDIALKPRVNSAVRLRRRPSSARPPRGLTPDAHALPAPPPPGFGSRSSSRRPSVIGSTVLIEPSALTTMSLSAPFRSSAANRSLSTQRTGRGHRQSRGGAGVYGVTQLDFYWTSPFLSRTPACSPGGLARRPAGHGDRPHLFNLEDPRAPSRVDCLLVPGGRCPQRDRE